MGTQGILLMTRKVLWNLDMVTESNIGQMELIMKETGILIKLKVKEHFGMQKEMYIAVNSKTIWPTGMESILT